MMTVRSQRNADFESDVIFTPNVAPIYTKNRESPTIRLPFSVFALIFFSLL